MNDVPKLKNFFIRTGNKESVLKKVYSNDTLLIGYPKSGNTWLRFLVGNYITNNNVDFDNKDSIIPSIEKQPNRCNELARPRFIHTHVQLKTFIKTNSSFGKGLPKIIFIVRDGRDFAVSYYYHLKKYRSIPYEMEFAEYLTMFNQGKYYPNQPWGIYIKTWVDKAAADSERFLLVRYEDLIRDAESEITQVILFAGLDLNNEKVKAAVEASSFENMKQHEIIKYADPIRKKPSDERIRFMRKGSVKQWEELFAGDMEKSFYEVHQSALTLLGYNT